MPSFINLFYQIFHRNANDFIIPPDGYILEFCAGLADRRDETEAELVRRELLEETG